MRATKSGLVVALAWLAAAAPSQAQQGTLVGTVTDLETGVTIAAAELQILGGGQTQATAANNQGQYRIQIPAGSYSIAVSSFGYLSERFDGISVIAGETTTFDIRLTSRAFALDPIQITVGRSQVGEKATEAPATTHTVSSLEITERPTPNPADHLREAPGVDVITSGLQSTNVVVRGFNNIFSGALHMLTDHRLAGVPSLRVNLMHFIPAVDEDIDRMEVVLGPGSALYGPNTANGVVHMLTKSPLQSQGSTITLGVGERSVFQGSFRTAFLLSDDFGFKLSSQYMRGEEWGYVDPTEQDARDAADASPAACVLDRSARGLSTAEAQLACQRLGVRDFDIERWGLEARADYRFANDGTVVGTYGRNSSSGIEMTGLGAGQTNEWVYQYMQARVSKGRFFAQAYYNTSDAGDSFLLRDGVALIDQSTLLVAQAQHGFTLADERQEFTYGVDYFATRPDSRGSIYGSYENEDDIDEWGAYIQSKTALSEKFDFIVAGRMDNHSILPENVWSPRAALVFKPTEGQNVRFSYNRAFSTPTALNLFLDISGGLAPSPIGPLGYTVRAYGTGPNGWALQGSNGELLGMRSPFYPGGSSQLLPADIPTMWAIAVGVLQAQGAINAGTAQALLSFNPSNTDIGRLLRDTNTGAVTPLASTVLPDVPPMVESNTETYELGWTGLVQDRVSITADVFYMKKNAFGSPLIVQTPLLFMNPNDIATFLTPRVGAATAAQLAAGMGMLPIGVVSSDQVGAQGADLIATYRNVGDVDLWGGDVAFQAYLNDQWTLGGSYSHVSEDYFQIAGSSPIALNAPKDKGSLSLSFRDVVRGLNASTRMRVSRAFPAESAGYVGTLCIDDGMIGDFEEDCVDDFAIFDLSAGYTIRNTGATVQLSVNNVLGTPYRSFVGVPKIGRFAMVRLRYDF